MKISSSRLLGLLVLAFCVSVFLPAASSAQKVKLRSQTVPACATASSLKYADLHADGNIAVLGSFNCRGVFIFDISDPDNPTLASWYNPGANLQFLEAIVIGNRGYFGTGNSSGVHIVDLTNPASPQLLGIVNASNGGGYPTIHEMMVFDQGNARYLLENSNSTSLRPLRIIDVTNPAAAVLKWEFSHSDNGWVHAMHIRGNRLYLSGFSSSTRTDIIDISNLATQAPSFLGTVAVGLGSNHSSWTSEDGNYLYSARETTQSNGTSPGDIRVYNVSNPASPTLVNRITMTDLGINAVTPHNPVVMGNKLYVSWYQAGLQVFDITNPANPVWIGQYDTYTPAFVPEESVLDNSVEPWDIFCGRDSFGMTLPTTYAGLWAVYPFLGEDKVIIGDLSSGLIFVDVTGLNAPANNRVTDFDGDRKTDLSVYTPAAGLWQVETSSDQQMTSSYFGVAEDRLVAGDYDGDGKSDIAVWRPSTGTWYILPSTGGFRAVQFGQNGDVPVAGDFDADGRTDLAVWRPSNGVWYLNQSTLGLRFVQWGVSTDIPVVGDFEGDGKADFAVWRPSNGVWYVNQSSSSLPIYTQFGASGDKPLFGDFDGDGRADYTVYRPSTGVWYTLRSTNGSFTAYQFGIDEDIPVPGDYDGDGRADISVYRPSTNVWYRVNSGDQGISARVFGSPEDRPAPTSVQPQ
ncbi:MAG: VCBS repeat-containing protein [Acidobacteria bacterium]|nr:VCBS repeat-containing protein [Acidobacteriota bacterium]